MTKDSSCQTDTACGCGDVAASYAAAPRSYQRVLWIVLLLNAAMLLLEAIAGQLAGSMALWSAPLK
jgi:Co/Zn/Cd efflux system component